MMHRAKRNERRKVKQSHEYLKRSESTVIRPVGKAIESPRDDLVLPDMATALQQKVRGKGRKSQVSLNGSRIGTNRALLLGSSQSQNTLGKLVNHFAPK